MGPHIVNSADVEQGSQKRCLNKNGVPVTLHVRPFKLKRRKSSNKNHRGLPKRHGGNTGFRKFEEEAGMFRVHQTIGNIPCCQCGIPIKPNAANMCAKCLQSKVDITEGLQKHITIMRCPQCESFLQPPTTWIKAQLESRELLAFCLKRLNLKRVVLVDAAFVWTEPHSKRIKVNVKVGKQILSEAWEKAYVVEYNLMDYMCVSCSRVQANPDQWVAAVQLRQHVSHRKTFFYLEQLILKHDATARAIRIKQMDEGIDFFYANRSHALKFLEFVRKVVPIKKPQKDKSLVSHDRKSNNYDYRYTYSVEICPICRDDLICLPRNVSISLGNLGPLVLCTKVSSNIVLMDPFTLRCTFMNADKYWRSPFRPLFSSKQLVEYVVLDVQPLCYEAVVIGDLKYALTDVVVARVSDLGKNDQMFTVRTHLGHLLNPGDYALGYDLHGGNINDMEFDRYSKSLSLPDAILIKKRHTGKPRPWKLIKSMKMEVDKSHGKLEEKLNTEYDEFVKDLEENPDRIFNISLNTSSNECEESELSSLNDAEDHVPSLSLEELLDHLVIKEGV